MLSKKNVLIFVVAIAAITGVTFLAGLVVYINFMPIRIFALIALNLANGGIAVGAMLLSGMKINIDFKEKKQYIIGVLIALSLSLVIAVIPALCGLSLIGGHSDFSWFSFLFDLFFYMLIIGPVEELIFRVYMQELIVDWLPRYKWLGVVIAAFLFGLWHIINGSIIQVLFTFGIGLVFGFAKYKIKDCGYVGVAVGHGLYDFLNTVVRMFIL